MHWERRAASRAAWTAGSNSAIKTAMIAITTSSSISVNPLRRVRARIGLDSCNLITSVLDAPSAATRPTDIPKPTKNHDLAHDDGR